MSILLLPYFPVPLFSGVCFLFLPIAAPVFTVHVPSASYVPPSALLPLPYFPVQLFFRRVLSVSSHCCPCLCCVCPYCFLCPSCCCLAALSMFPRAIVYCISCCCLLSVSSNCCPCCLRHSCCPTAPSLCPRAIILTYILLLMSLLLPSCPCPVSPRHCFSFQAASAIRAVGRRVHRIPLHRLIQTRLRQLQYFHRTRATPSSTSMSPLSPSTLLILHRSWPHPVLLFWLCLSSPFVFLVFCFSLVFYMFVSYAYADNWTCEVVCLYVCMFVY